MASETKAATAFRDKLASAMTASGSLLCVGLDPDPTRFPAAMRSKPVGEAIVAFNRAIVDATSDLVCAYKPNLAFYAAEGLPGLEALLATRELIPRHIPVLLDCKVNDVGNTAAAWARGLFGTWQFDAITVNPYLGEDSIAPFLSYPERGVFILCKTSNPGSGELQDLTVGASERPLFLDVAARARQWAKDYPATVGLVVGATYPAQLGEVRTAVGDLPILVPGVGTQAGDAGDVVAHGLNGAGAGLVINASRAITYAGSGDDFADKARLAATRFRDQINTARAKVTP